MNRSLSSTLALLSVLTGCHRPTEVHGLYISQDSLGAFFPCDDPKMRVVVKDAALDARYRSLASVHEPLFVRLRGIKGHSGSPKGGGQYLFEVQQILEVRARASGECPGVAQSIAPLLPPS
jgi:hypothetical protein